MRQSKRFSTAAPVPQFSYTPADISSELERAREVLARAKQRPAAAAQRAHNQSQQLVTMKSERSLDEHWRHISDHILHSLGTPNRQLQRA